VGKTYLTPSRQELNVGWVMGFDCMQKPLTLII
jgi:hypothetical protein